MFRIDSHQSFTAGHPPEHFGPILTRNRFAGSVCIVEPHAPLSVADFNFVLAIVVRQSPGASIESWRSHPKFRGVLWDADTLRSDAPPPADRLDLALHTSDLPAVQRLAESRPELPIVLDHLAGPDLTSPDLQEWSRAIEQLARLPQVYCKLSGLVRLTTGHWNAATLRPYVHHALRCFGPERTMFGSGWPDCLPEYGWKETLAAFTQALGAAPIPMREELLGGAAARFYGISEPPAPVL